ncbi:hypothetical protein TWF481_004577 [Arthrobotrys musiformis]|uniref:Rhodopsin domain-containing protein n=1 Tax=Arthrobotrys musiformis TaxID=47236 RepID=A0AAV9WQN9_9PEZI
MTNPVNITELLRLSKYNDAVQKSGLLTAPIPPEIWKDKVLNPNYVPTDLSTLLLIITWLCIFVPLVGVILRFLARFGTESPLGLDDWFSAVAWVASAAYCSTSIAGVKLTGAGQHIWYASGRELDVGYTLGYLQQIFYGIASFFLHMAIMFFYIRIIPPELFARKVLYAFFTFHIIYLPIYVTVASVQCSPVRSSYDLKYRLEVGEGNKCLNPFKLALVLTIVGIITDCLLFLLPLSMVWGMSLEFGKKVLVSGLFLLGGLACVTSGIRLHYLKALYAGFDRTFDVVPVSALGHIEIALGLLTACLPMMRQAILLLPHGSFYSLMLSRIKFRWRRRRRRRREGVILRGLRRGHSTIRIRKPGDSRSTADHAEERVAEPYDLRELEVAQVPPAPAIPPPVAIEAGCSKRNPPSFGEGSGGRSRPSTRGSGSANRRNSRHDRFVRDIMREACKIQDSGEAIEMEDMWVMMEDGPIRLPIIRHQSPRRSSSRSRSRTRGVG